MPAGEHPEHIDIDVTELELHQAIRVRDLAADGTWTPVTDGDTMLVHVVLPRGRGDGARPRPTPARRPSPK